MHYSGFLTNGVGEAIDCSDPFQCLDSYDLTFRLYEDAVSAVVIWEETHTNTPIYSGTFSVVLGTQVPILPSHLSNLAWLALKVNENPEMEPRQQVVSAPYALHAQNAIAADLADNASQLGGVEAGDYALVQSLSALENSLSPVAVTGLPSDLADGDDDSLGAMTCGPGMIAKASLAGWVCALDEVGSTDTTLTEEEVDAMVANNGYAGEAALSSAQGAITTLQTDLLAAQSSLTDAQTSIASIQEAVGENDSELSVLESNLSSLQGTLTTLQNNLSALEGSLAPVASTGNFGDLVGIPAGLADGDDNSDVLASLACADGEHAQWDGAVWACVRGATAVQTVDPGPCDASTVGAMYFDVASGVLNICNGTAYQSLKVCSGLCPVAVSVPCGLDILDDCGEVCGTGTGLNTDNCTASSSVACGGTLSDSCGNTCGGLGTALNSAQCNAAATNCGGTVVDTCGNSCGTTGTLCGGSEICQAGVCSSLIEHFDTSSTFFNAHPVDVHSAARAIDACNHFYGTTSCAVGTGSCGGATYVYDASGPNCACGSHYIFYYGTEGSGFIGGSADHAGKAGPACSGPSFNWY
jgi:hypothetical protein